MQETKPPEHRRRVRLVIPSRSDALLRNFTELVGGPMGRRCAPGVISPGFFTVERVLIMLTVLAAVLGILIKSYCRTSGWETPGQFYATCYSDFPELFKNRGLGDGAFPFITPGTFFEYPVLMGFIAGSTAVLVPGGGVSAARILAYFDINATLIAAVWIITVLATARMARRRRWDAAMVAVAPGIILAGTINWDMWAVGLLALGMYCFSRNKLVLAGIFIGLGTATKLYPLLILGAVLLLALRTGKVRAILVTAGAGAAAWLAVNVPVAAANTEGWRYFYQFTEDRPAGYSSPWFAYNLVAGRLGWQPLQAEAINTLALNLFVLACVLIAVLALAASRRPRLAQLAFLIVAAFILTNKVYSPQFVIWLIPLLALARPRWRDFLIWQTVEGLHWAAVWMYLGQVTSGGVSQHNIDMPYYVLAVAFHMIAIGYLMVRVAWDIWDPGYDVVRRQGMDDPQGGPFDGAPDRLRVDLFHPTKSVLPWRKESADA
ncbi:glycosyltransferase 87 family protein [Arthrobacter sp. AL08]|uniref:glycosyltransferase family 87 protein n=1 Tax=Micrococcaceae TaxID=1268 RepID=UPI00249CBBD2|nr:MULTISPECIES: glycosyltransferase 87 family protein [Micrococcaceae]MDI3242052.1 glycosyltransferase 87 family protein [Arthrobacter sp. AL05]MDI3278008.1 glycosyltransferase 87 family protein [Arthrobacter sp. AL08]MDJ0352522.1 glycosyltransferase 87 family protein [Pseudarthrobacter sp. PH31-O2]